MTETATRPVSAPVGGTGAPRPRYRADEGWQYLNQSGTWCGCPPPFRTHKQAVDYALARLKATEDSPYAVIVDARAALEWAAAL